MTICSVNERAAVQLDERSCECVSRSRSSTSCDGKRARDLSARGAKKSQSFRWWVPSLIRPPPLRSFLLRECVPPLAPFSAHPAHVTAWLNRIPVDLDQDEDQNYVAASERFLEFQTQVSVSVKERIGTDPPLSREKGEEEREGQAGGDGPYRLLDITTYITSFRARETRANDAVELCATHHQKKQVASDPSSCALAEAFWGPDAAAAAACCCAERVVRFVDGVLPATCNITAKACRYGCVLKGH